GLSSLAQALDSIDDLTIDPADRARFRVDVLSEALTVVRSGGADPTVRLGGHPASEPALRDGLESALRELAVHAGGRDEKVALVDRANAVRRWTLR
ncbi:MAG TPA: tetratricopeptide repeat protein, partial [Actinotalea sp.]|nr:tetratricopeptide repeat protein [Actinotalea sp.]